jgi:hypothetical protein
MRVCIAIGARVVRTTGAVIGGAWDGVAWLGIDELPLFSFQGLPPSRSYGAAGDPGEIDDLPFRLKKNLK